MKRAVLLLVVLMVACATRAGAGEEGFAPEATVLWNSCVQADSSLSEEFAGPGVYRQVVVARGLTQPFVGVIVELEMVTSLAGGCSPYPPFPDAWRFDDGGCQGGYRRIWPQGFGAACPGLAATNRADLSLVDFGTTSYGREGLTVFAFSSFDVFYPNPATSYVLMQIGYNHRNSEVGPSGQGCGGIETAMCFKVRRVDIIPASGDPRSCGEDRCITWQTTPGCACGYCSPVLRATWGRIKAVYR
jgi:hypothetical protein